MRLLGAVSVAAMAVGLLPISPASAAEVGAAEVEDICPAPGQTDAFTDDTDSTFEDRINCAAAYGLVTGYPDGTFRPANFLTRGQAATLLVNYVETADCDTALETDDDDDFTDIEDSVHENNIQKAADNGIVVGYSDDTFRPDQLINRAQFATMAVQATELALGEDLSADDDGDFDDISGNVHENNIEKAFDNGLLVGTSPGMFSPDDNVTRGQATSIVIGAAGQVLFPAGEFCPADPGGPGFETLTVSPAEDQTVECVAGIDDDDDSDNVEITVTGVSSTEMYRLTLVDADNISTDDEGFTTFVEDADTGLALAGTLDARIVTVNGAAPTTIGQTVGAVMAVGGEITFVIECNGGEAVVPVVYTDQGGDNTRLNLDDDGRPTEPFGIGGTITFTEPPAPESPFGPESLTGAPELQDVTISATDGTVVTYTFDEAIPGQNLQFFGEAPNRFYTGFRLYLPDGTALFPSEARVSGDSVIARFDNVQDVATATRAGVTYDAVEDEEGIANIEGEIPLAATIIPADVVGPYEPQLIEVENFRLAGSIANNTQQVLVDYVFDGPTPFEEGDSGDGFFLVGAASQLYTGVVVDDVDTDCLTEVVTEDCTEVVTVEFAADLTDVPESQLRRGFVEFPDVDADDGFLLLSEDYESTGGQTVDPDLVGAAVADTDEDDEFIVRYVFDEAISDVGLDSSQFYLYDSDGNTIQGVSAERSAIVGDGATVVLVDFGPLAGFVPVGVYLEDSAVLATDNTASVNQGGNRPDERTLALPIPDDDTVIPPGFTALPDLLEVDVEQNVVTENFSVAYTFDEPCVDLDASQVAFDLYDALGAQFRVSGAVDSGPDDGVTIAGTATTCTVTFTIDETVDDAFLADLFDNEQIAAAVTGAVQDLTEFLPGGPGEDGIPGTGDDTGPSTNQPVVTEGQVAVS